VRRAVLVGDRGSPLKVRMGTDAGRSVTREAQGYNQIESKHQRSREFYMILAT